MIAKGVVCNLYYAAAPKRPVCVRVQDFAPVEQICTALSGLQSGFNDFKLLVGAWSSGTVSRLRGAVLQRLGGPEAARKMEALITVRLFLCNVSVSYHL